MVVYIRLRTRNGLGWAGPTLTTHTFSNVAEANVTPVRSSASYLPPPFCVTTNILPAGWLQVTSQLNLRQDKHKHPPVHLPSSAHPISLCSIPATKRAIRIARHIHTYIYTCTNIYESTTIILILIPPSPPDPALPPPANRERDENQAPT